MSRETSEGVHLSLYEKRDCLLKALKNIGGCVIAFSGGVDSTLLLAAAVRVLGKRVEAVTVHTPYVPGRELRQSRELAASLGAELHVIEMDLPEELEQNPEQRCYLCKGRLFSRIEAHGHRSGKTVLLDGSNADDGKAHRPGMRALKEMGVRSPLAECGFTKKDVRDLARIWNLDVWSKPAYSCLLTRLPHGISVDNDLLRRVEGSEEFLIHEGFPSVRVRTHGDKGDIARIEIPPAEREKFCKIDRMDRVDEALRKMGYRYVTLDLAGYRSGSMDPESAYNSRSDQKAQKDHRRGRGGS